MVAQLPLCDRNLTATTWREPEIKHKGMFLTKEEIALWPGTDYNSRDTGGRGNSSITKPRPARSHLFLSSSSWKSLVNRDPFQNPRDSQYMCQEKFSFKSNPRRILLCEGEPSLQGKPGSLRVGWGGVQKARLESNAGCDPHLLPASGYLCALLGET